MQVRGAPLIGVAAAYGIALAMQRDGAEAALADAHATLARDSPDRRQPALGAGPHAVAAAAAAAAERAGRRLAGGRPHAEEDVATTAHVGSHGAALLAAAHARTRQPVRVLTHCNAGWIATVDYGTALSAVYQRTTRRAGARVGRRDASAHQGC